MKISKKKLRQVIRETLIREMAGPPPEEGAPAAAPKTKQKRWKAEVTSDYDAGYAAGMADEVPPEDASRSWDDGYTDALADIAAEEEAAAVAAAPPVA